MDNCTAEEIELDCPNGRCYRALRWGDPSGIPLLGLHGWMDNAATFSALAPLLDDVHLVSVDLPGHGKTAPLPDGVYYHYIDQLSDLDSVVAALGWEQAGLIGHSMGGTLVTTYAAAFPERISAVIAIDALGPMFGAPEKFVERIRKGIISRAEHRPGQQRYFATREQAVTARQASGGLSETAANHLASRGLEQLDEGWSWRVDRRHRLPSLAFHAEQQIEAVLAAVTTPTLVISAEDTHLTGLPEMIEKRFLQLQNGQLSKLTGGHHLHLENASACAEVINRFLAQLD
jgi:pimeloyl-ACP methyl ester carboxylesterase